MGSDTFQMIQNLSEERFQLYLLAGHGGLTPDQVTRVDEITGRLAGLWDQHRREIASRSRETVERMAVQARHAKLDAEVNLAEEDRRVA